MKHKGLIGTILTIIFYTLICWCCCIEPVKGETVGCMVICEIPEEPVRYTIPKVKGSGYFELKEGQVIYQVIERNQV